MTKAGQYGIGHKVSDYTVFIKNYQMTKNPRAYQVVNEWFEDRMEEGAPPKTSIRWPRC